MTKRIRKTESPRRFTKGLADIGRLVPGLTKAALGKKGLAFGDLIARWREIVGPELGRETQPVQLSFPHGARNNGTLYIGVPSGLALDLAHDTPRILARINAYFGYSAVARIKLVQIDTTDAPAHHRPTFRRLLPDETAAIDTAVEEVTDPDLRDALARLGKTMRARTR
ncbi:MAG: DciA family protein [Pseudomonadota bacterium]|nr:DciA family protein [Pseudomonadota bacterium]